MDLETALERLCSRPAICLALASQAEALIGILGGEGGPDLVGCLVAAATLARPQIIEQPGISEMIDEVGSWPTVRKTKPFPTCRSWQAGPALSSSWDSLCAQPEPLLYRERELLQRTRRAVAALACRNQAAASGPMHRRCAQEVQELCAFEASPAAFCSVPCSLLLIRLLASSRRALPRGTTIESDPPARPPQPGVSLPWTRSCTPEPAVRSWSPTCRASCDHAWLEGTRLGT